SDCRQADGSECGNYRALHCSLDGARTPSSSGQITTEGDRRTAPRSEEMGLTDFFDVIVTAQDPEVQRFKPDPEGLELVLQRLAVRMSEAVYIGDREDVDAVAASRAGIQYFIL